MWRVYDEQSVNKIILQFASLTFIIEAEPADDTIAFDVTSKQEPNTEHWREASTFEPWNTVIGKPFAWGWLTINHFDARNGVLLGFCGNTPQVLITAVASSIKESIVLLPPTR